MSKDNGTFWTLSRVISGMIAMFYVAIAAIYSEAYVAIRVAVFCVLPLACIWFSDWMGNYRGFLVSFPLRRISWGSPPSLVAFLGWVVLLSPPAFYWAFHGLSR